MEWSEFLFKIAITFIAALGFALFYNVRKCHVLYATIGGVITWIIYYILHSMNAGLLPSCLIASMFAAIYAEVLSHIYKTPTAVFFLISVIPLVPGRGLYYTMFYAVSTNWEQCGAFALSTFESAAGIALGICAIGAVVQTWIAFKKHAEKLARKQAQKLKHYALLPCLRLCNEFYSTACYGSRDYPCGTRVLQRIHDPTATRLYLLFCSWLLSCLA